MDIHFEAVILLPEGAEGLLVLDRDEEADVVVAVLLRQIDAIMPTELGAMALFSFEVGLELIKGDPVPRRKRRAQQPNLHWYCPPADKRRHRHRQQFSAEARSLAPSNYGVHGSPPLSRTV